MDESIDEQPCFRRTIARLQFALLEQPLVSRLAPSEVVVMAANPVMPPAPLQITVERSPLEIVVKCSGKLTHDVASQLKTEVKPLITRTKRIVLDLTDLAYMDSAGLGTVVGLYASAKSAGCELKLINLGQRVRDLLRITKLITVFEPFGEHL